MKVDYIIEALNVIKEDEELDIKNLKRYKNELLITISKLEKEILSLNDKINDYQQIRNIKRNPKSKLFILLFLFTIIIFILSFIFPNILLILSTIISTIVSLSIIISKVDNLSIDDNVFFKNITNFIKDFIKSDEEIENKIKELEFNLENKVSELNSIKNNFSFNDTKIEEKQDELSFIDGMLDSMNWLINHQNIVEVNDNTIAVNYVKKRVLNI